MHVIAGDVGGTKTLLRKVDASGAIVDEARFDSSAYATFDDLLRAFDTRDVEAACFAVAGPVFGGRAEVTNLPWEMDEKALSRAFDIPHVSLVNDFYAVALGVPLLGESDLLSLQKGQRDRNAPIGILGAGTGLGEALLVHGQVVPTEGGHQDFAPQDEEQARLFLELHRRHGHVSWERVVSGMGLTNIHTFLGGAALTPADISDRAEAGDPRARHTFEIFVDAYGSEAGNLALRALARGGIFLAGGVAAKNRDWFTDGRFLEAFLRKGRFRELLETVPVDLIVNQEVGLMGAVARALESTRGVDR
ncbi:MAG TPA: glucokinase [Thermoanaerobaculia bacterium]|jgi:glucokinase|nr:glucokinase [Thermoanaerobaculia bacterium]